MATRAMRAEIRSKFECTRAQDFPFFYGISQPFKDVDSSGRETRAERCRTIISIRRPSNREPGRHRPFLMAASWGLPPWRGELVGGIVNRRRGLLSPTG